MNSFASLIRQLPPHHWLAPWCHFSHSEHRLVPIFSCSSGIGKSDSTCSTHGIFFFFWNHYNCGRCNLALLFSERRQEVSLAFVFILWNLLQCSLWRVCLFDLYFVYFQKAFWAFQISSGRLRREDNHAIKQWHAQWFSNGTLQLASKDLIFFFVSLTIILLLCCCCIVVLRPR